MKKWLIGLAVLGVTSLVLSSRRLNKRLAAQKRLRQFINALENNELQSIMNETLIDQYSWKDVFAGNISDKEFSFWMKAVVGPGRTEEPDSEREYYFSWGGHWIKAKARTAGRDGEFDQMNEFEQIHDLLRKIYRGITDEQPS